MNALLSRAASGLAAIVLAACGGPHGDGQPLKSSPAADCARQVPCQSPPIALPATRHRAARRWPAVRRSSRLSACSTAATSRRDPEHGIGRWSADDFYKAMHDGTSPGGRQLYPAMPYTSYRAMPRDDVDAVFAYLMQLPPVATPSRQADLRFPYNMRFGVFFWKLLFLEDELPAATAGQSADWQRGRYRERRAGPLRRVPHSARLAGPDEERRAVARRADRPLARA